MTANVPAKILVADPLARDGIERLKKAGTVDVVTGLSPSELKDRIGPYTALVVRSETQVTADLLSAATELRVVARAGVGVDNIDIDAATQHGVLVLNAPTGNTVAAAEHTVAMMMAMMRHIPAADHSLRAGEWKRSQFVGNELRGKTLGLLGLGKIGCEVARCASQGLQMHVIAYDPLTTADRAQQYGAELCDIPELIARADILSVHVPLNEHTKGIIGERELRAMKPGACVINVARGGIIDEDALAVLLAEGHIGGAALDVFVKEPLATTHPLLQFSNVVVTPHLGASTQEAQTNVAFDVADQIAEYFHGGLPRYAVNAPSIAPEELAVLQPYMMVAYKAGSLAAQLAPSPTASVTCTFAGEIAQFDTAVLTAEVLRGLFGQLTDTRVNTVNALSVAQSLGIAVDEQRTTRLHDYANSISITVDGSTPLTIVGTQFDGDAWITRINDFRVDIRPEGRFLVVTHEDRPGVVAAISSELARHNINIASMQLGRDHPRGEAVMFMQIDEPIDEELRTTLQDAVKLRSLRVVHL